MPTYILRCDRNEDAYVLWSTVVDAPVSEVLTAAGMSDELARRGESGNGQRLIRARLSGSSCTGDIADWFSWTDENLLVANVFPGYRELPRTNLLAFCRAHDRDDEAAMLSLTTACEDAS